MPTEAIAEVVHDVKTGRYRRVIDPQMAKIIHEIAELGTATTIVDSTKIYEQLADTVRKYNYYEDYPSMSPPWKQAAICYENQHGNVMVMPLVAGDRRHGSPIAPWDPDPADDKIIEWDAVRWVMEVPIFVGGRGGNGRAETFGPVHMWRFAVYETGALADLRWVDFTKGQYPIKHWDMALLTFQSTINFMGCRNVEVQLPTLPRAERRRTERAAPGVRVGVLRVRSMSKSSTGRTGPSEEPWQPLHSVVGHPAHYGNCCPGRHEPKGMLFGKLEGRFWVPQHARGQRDAGEVRNDYELLP